jgi:hypothetical protein
MRGRLQFPTQWVRQQTGRPLPRTELFRVEPLTASFHTDATQCVRFRLSEWPVRQEELRDVLAATVGSFLQFVQSGVWHFGC